MARVVNGAPARFNTHDNYVTSKEGWEVVKKYLPENLKIWCPFYHGGEVTDNFNYENIIHAKKDFFTWQPEEWDIICDNPPYSIKKNVIKRCVELGKPFGLLLPMDVIERQYFRTLVVENPNVRITIVIPKNRIKFVKDNKVAGSNPIVTYWYLFNILDGDNNIIFET